MKPLWQVVIDWFELTYGYNPDPSTVLDGDILRWALKRRQKAEYGVVRSIS